MSDPRNARLADQARTIPVSILKRGVKDSRLGFVAIIDVRLIGGNREATVFYAVTSDKSARAETTAALASATNMLCTAVGSQLQLRHTPTLTLMLDATPGTARSIEDPLAKAQTRDAEAAAKAMGKPFAGDTDPYRKPRTDDDHE